MSDPTEAIRRKMIATGQPARDLAALNQHKPDCKSGNQGPEWSGSALPDDSGWECDECGAVVPATWTTAELTAEFEVIGFAAPFCVVKRRSDGVKGSMEFTHSPRVYFNFVADKA